MAAILEFNGIRITVPISELGEAVRQLSIAQSHSKPAAMRLDEASPRLVNSSAVATPSARVGQDVDEVPQFSSRVPRKPSEIRSAVAFLQMLVHENLFSERALPEEAMRIFQVQHSKGLGSKLAAVNRLIDSCGFALPDVYVTGRDAHGSFWLPGPRIDLAIGELSALALRTEEKVAERTSSHKHPITITPIDAENQQVGQVTLEEDEVQPEQNEKSP